jgi:hypothetical protein
VSEERKTTPWRRVFERFGLSQSEFAKALNQHRSKVSRVLADDDGLISGRDQARLFDLARARNIPLTPDDVTPNAG